MNLRNKKVWLTIVTMVGLIWVMPSRVPRQIVTMPDGRQYRFAGVTWGTNHGQPRLLARLTDYLPAAWGNFVRNKYGTQFGLRPPFRTTEPALCVWLQPLDTKTPSATVGKGFDFELTDQNGVMVGRQPGGLGTVGGNGRLPEWVFMVASVFPRRSATLQMVIFDPYTVTNGAEREIGRFIFRNQMSGQFPQWQPEAIPAVKMIGDVEVRLTNFTTGFIPNVMTLLGVESVFDVIISPASGKDHWTIENAELSDATGNHLRADHYHDILSYRRTISGTLWPDEAAWRLRLELKPGSSGAGDSVVFTNVSVPTSSLAAMNLPPMITVNHDGIRVVLTRLSRSGRGRVRGVPDLEIQAELPDRPEGVALGFALAAMQSGESIFAQTLESGDQFMDSVTLNPVPTNVTTLNLVFTLQKTRSVEFLVRPRSASERVNKL